MPATAVDSAHFTALAAALASAGFTTSTWAGQRLYIRHPDVPDRELGYLTIEEDGSVGFSRFIRKGRAWRAEVARAIAAARQPPGDPSIGEAAEQLLDRARRANPGGSCGCAEQGTAQVTWDRPAQIYVVGTATREVARGRRSEVLPALLALLGGADE